MKVYYLFMVLLWSLGMLCYSQVAQSSISQNTPSKFTWHTEESFHAHGPMIQINTSNNAEEEEDDEGSDEDEFKLKCIFSKKDIRFTSTHFKESLITLHPILRLSKPFLKPQFTPPDFILIK
jgi:hypothetical protein